MTGLAGSSAFESFVHSIDSSDLDFRESLDLEALARIEGPDRDRGEHPLLARARGRSISPSRTRTREGGAKPSGRSANGHAPPLRWRRGEPGSRRPRESEARSRRCQARRESGQRAADQQAHAP